MKREGTLLVFLRLKLQCCEKRSASGSWALDCLSVSRKVLSLTSILLNRSYNADSKRLTLTSASRLHRSPITVSLGRPHDGWTALMSRTSQGSGSCNEIDNISTFSKDTSSVNLISSHYAIAVLNYLFHIFTITADSAQL